MANSISKNVEKTCYVAGYSSVATIIAYLICIKFHLDQKVMEPAIIVVLTGIIGGLHNYLKHIGLSMFKSTKG